eukprot:2817059-Pyramimonas_sp.AAC.2
MTGCEMEAASAASGSEVAYEATGYEVTGHSQPDYSKDGQPSHGHGCNPALSVLIHGGFRWPRPARKKKQF